MTTSGYVKDISFFLCLNTTSSFYTLFLKEDDFVFLGYILIVTLVVESTAS